MLGRKKKNQPAHRTEGQARPLGTDEYMGLMRSFLDEQVGQSGQPPRPGAPAPIGGAGAPTGQFVFNITQVTGPETAMAGVPGPGAVINVPGIGPVNTGAMQNAMRRMGEVMGELFGEQYMPSKTPSPEQMRAAQDRLQALRDSGRVSEAQYVAIGRVLASHSQA